MKKIEYVLGILAGISIIYKLLLGNDLNLFLILSLSGLSLFYTYFSFIYFNRLPVNKVFKKQPYKKLSKWRLIGTISLGLGLGLTLLGMLWTLMSWPFNSYYSIGIPMLIFVGLIAFVKYRVTRADIYISVLKRVIIVGIFGFAFWLNPHHAFRKYENTEVVKEQLEQEKDL